MKSFWQCVLVFLLFFIAATAVIQVDWQCREMTGMGGSVTAFADAAVEAVAEAAAESAGHMVESAGHMVESAGRVVQAAGRAADSAEIVVEKAGLLE